MLLSLTCSLPLVLPGTRKGVFCDRYGGVAAPEFDRDKASYGIAIAAPKFRMTAQSTAAITQAVVAAAAAVTKDLAAVDF